MICANKCNKCRDIVFVSKIDVKESNIIFVLPERNLYNGEKICFAIPHSLTISDKVLPIFLKIGDNLYPWLSQSGSFVYSDQVRHRRLYIGRVRTDTSVFMNAKCNLNRTSFDFPVIPTDCSVKLITYKGGENK